MDSSSRCQSATDYPSSAVSEKTVTKGGDVVSQRHEKATEVLSTVDEQCPAPVTPLFPKDEYPDGGLRAWLVVFGVGCSSSGM